MPSASLTSKGQVTVPKAIRDFLRVQQGDRLEFTIEGRQVILHPGRSDLRSLRGLLARRGRKPVTLQQMDAAIAREHARRR